MARARVWLVGVGCLLVILGLVIVALVVLGLRGAPLSGRLVIALHLDRPIVERTVPDPFAELAGEQPTSLRDLRAVLTRAATDDRVVGLRLRLDNPGGGLATAQQVRGLLGGLRSAGKWSAAYLDTAGEFAPGNTIYYLATGCDEISLHPMGDVNLIGLSISFPFFRGALDKLGIKADYPGRGAYKDARFQYTHTQFTPEQRAMYEWLGGSLSAQLAAGIASGRGLEEDQVRHLIDSGPYGAQEALAKRLVDHLEDWDDFSKRVAARADGAEVVGARTYLKRAVRSRSGPKIAVVTALGVIMRGENSFSVNPLLGGQIMGSETVSRALRNARRTPGVRAVVLRLDSPGGTPLASEIIRREVVRTAADLPVVVSISNVGASGGYWIACGGQKIVADAAALVGSIGVFGGHLATGDFFADKLGITFGQMQFGANADLYGTLDPWTDPQRALMVRSLDQIYERFVGIVAEARDMSRDQVEAIAEGRVFTGKQGKQNGLVDQVGGLDEALAVARSLAGIPPEARVELVDFPRLVPWWKQLLEHRSDEELAVREAAELASEAWRTGAVRLPGPTWMPPIVVE